MVSNALDRVDRWWPGAALLGVLAAVFGALAPGLVARYHLPLRSAIGIYCCLLLMLVLVVAPGIPAARPWIEDRIRGRRKLPVLLFIWCLPYFFYAAGTHDLRWIVLARLIAVAAPLPLLYTFVPVHHLRRFGWQDLAVAVWLTTVLLSHQLAGIWSVPVNLDFLGRLFLISISAWCWVFVRPVPELGFEFRFSSKTLAAAGLNFALFTLLAIPVSLALHFTQWNPRPVSIASFCVNYLEIFIFIALLEELFFRGFLQTLISHNVRSPLRAQILVSVLFGLFHILHAPFPNWRYVLLATVAGWFYGAAFIKSGNLMASTLTHAMVDTVWRAFFTKG